MFFVFKKLLLYPLPKPQNSLTQGFKLVKLGALHSPLNINTVHWKTIFPTLDTWQQDPGDTQKKKLPFFQIRLHYLRSALVVGGGGDGVMRTGMGRGRLAS